jgi:hypothetical protein
MPGRLGTARLWALFALFGIRCFVRRAATEGPSLRRLVLGLVQLGSLPKDVAEDRLRRIPRRHG